jgi:hypothetical protein
MNLLYLSRGYSMKKLTPDHHNRDLHNEKYIEQKKKIVKKFNENITPKLLSKTSPLAGFRKNTSLVMLLT